MKKIYMMLIVVLLMVIAGCSKSSDPVPISLSSAKAITAFSLNGTAAMINGESNMISVTDGVVGTINETAKTITVTMPYGTDVTALVATFSTTGASVKVGSTVQISGTTANNFTSPVTYTVTAADATTQDYTVTVTVASGDYTSPNIGTLKYVPAGSFQRDGTPANISTVTTAFRMSQYEITQAQYVAVTTAANPSYFTGDTLPVEEVTWFDAVEFCNDLSALEGLTPVYTITSRTPGDGSHPITSATVTANWSNNGYRLPTEMEWMWAAMGATSGSGYSSPTYLTGYAKPFAGSNATNAAGNNGTNVIGDYAWTWENSSDGDKVVGTRLPNELGLYDMSGNVWEWVWDWYNGYPAGTLTDYRGAASGSYRVMRGGTWYYDASYATVASRDYIIPGEHYGNLGFRVVRP